MKKATIINWIIGIAVAGLAIVVAVKFLNTLGLIALIGVLLVVVVTASIIYKPVFGAYWIILALPFERLLTVDLGGITVKPIHAVVFAGLVGWAICFASGKIKKIVTPLPTVVIMLFFLSGLWSLSVSIDPQRTVMVLLFWLLAIVAYFLITQFVQSREDLKGVLVLLVVATGVLALFGFFQIIGDIAGLPKEITGIKPGYDKATFGLPRVHATLTEPLYYASYLLAPLFLSASYFIFGGVKNKIGKYLALTICLAVIISVVMTFSRGAFLGLAVAGILLIVWQYKHFFKLENIVIILSILMFGAMLVFGFFTIAEPRAVDEVYNHLSLSKRESESVVSRVNATEIAYDAWQGNKWRGIGLGAYGRLELEKYGEVHLVQGYYPIVNNQYLETLTETGVVGALLFGWLILSLLWRSAKAWLMAMDNFDKASLAGLTLGIVGLLMQYITFSTIYIVYVWVFIGLLVAVQEIIIISKIK